MVGGGRSSRGPTTPPEAGSNQDSTEPMTNLAMAFLGAGIAAGLSVVGVGIGIGRLAAGALEATGRQPAATGDIRTSMLIAAIGKATNKRYIGSKIIISTSLLL